MRTQYASPWPETRRNTSTGVRRQALGEAALGIERHGLPVEEEPRAERDHALHRHRATPEALPRAGTAEREAPALVVVHQIQLVHPAACQLVSSRAERRHVPEVAALTERAGLQAVLVLVRHALEQRLVDVGGAVDAQLVRASPRARIEAEVQRGDRALEVDGGLEPGLQDLGLVALAGQRGAAAIRLEAGRALRAHAAVLAQEAPVQLASGGGLDSHPARARTPREQRLTEGRLLRHFHPERRSGFGGHLDSRLGDAIGEHARRLRIRWQHERRGRGLRGLR